MHWGGLMYKVTHITEYFEADTPCVFNDRKSIKSSKICSSTICLILNIRSKINAIWRSKESKRKKKIK